MITVFNFNIVLVRILPRISIYMVLAHIIMETEKSHELLSPAGVPGKPMVFFRGLRASGIDCSLTLKAWKPERWRQKIDVPIHVVRQSTSESSFPPRFSFYLSPQWIAWCPPTLRRAICFTQSTSSNANLPETPSYTHLELMFNHISGHRVI